MPTSSHPTLLLQEQMEHRSGRVSSVCPGQPLCPTASSSPSSRQAPLSVRGRRGGTSVCESRPRCTVCTKPKKKKAEEMLTGCSSRVSLRSVQFALGTSSAMQCPKREKKKKNRVQEFTKLSDLRGRAAFGCIRPRPTCSVSRGWQGLGFPTCFTCRL